MSSVVKFVGKQYLALIITALMVLTVTIPGEKSYLSLEDEEVVLAAPTHRSDHDVW